MITIVEAEEESPIENKVSSPLRGNAASAAMQQLKREMHAYAANFKAQRRLLVVIQDALTAAAESVRAEREAQGLLRGDLLASELVIKSLMRQLKKKRVVSEGVVAHLDDVYALRRLQPDYKAIVDALAESSDANKKLIDKIIASQLLEKRTRGKEAFEITVEASGKSGFRDVVYFLKEIGSLWQEYAIPALRADRKVLDLLSKSS